jgi:ferrous iron transport protein A
VPPELPLSELAIDTPAVVVGIDAPAPLARRLAELGFLPRTPVTCRRRAPLGDPRIYEVRGAQLCLRRREARAVRVALRD